MPNINAKKESHNLRFSLIDLQFWHVKEISRAFARAITNFATAKVYRDIEKWDWSRKESLVDMSIKAWDFH